MKKNVLLCILSALFVISIPGMRVEAAKYASWNEIIDEMHTVLDKADDAYRAGDANAGKNFVNDAYFGFYEKEGVERAVLSYVSGKRASTVEYQFSAVKRLMTEGASVSEVRESLQLLKKMLREDANQLDGKEESAAGVFIASLLIILREGFEAILVIAAIAAYLIRSGNGASNRVVYGSAVGALIASALAAVALQYIFKMSGTANQEIIEGAAMLLAVVVLFFVSNWMVSKAESEAWKHYIEGKVQTAIETGSQFALGAAAFLAVFREGAETILFYQALFAETETYKNMAWAGFAVGCVALVFIFLAVQYGSLVIPIKPFFMGTSILMYIMSIAFAGGGVKELQEADVISVTPVNFVQSVDILGIYPTLETLLPQIVLLVIAIASIFYYRAKGRKARSVSA
ncbi:MAG: FTR1 family iron permease [Synergistaceae bacterium]|nr:FTR1 family iron permease [Synergistaceae bacterium]